MQLIFVYLPIRKLYQFLLPSGNKLALVYLTDLVIACHIMHSAWNTIHSHSFTRIRHAHMHKVRQGKYRCTHFFHPSHTCSTFPSSHTCKHCKQRYYTLLQRIITLYNHCCHRSFFIQYFNTIGQTYIVCIKIFKSESTSPGQTLLMADGSLHCEDFCSELQQF